MVVERAPNGESDDQYGGARTNQKVKLAGQLAQGK